MTCIGAHTLRDRCPAPARALPGACEDIPVLRSVTAEIDLEIAAPVDLIFQVAVARGVPVAVERLELRQGDAAPVVTELVDAHGSRLHRLRAEPGSLSMRYAASIAEPVPVVAPTALETITYLRPSRYCPSDEVFAQARRQFAGLSGTALLAAVTDFVAESVTYSPGLSAGTDSAVTTLRTGQGVCRDFAHVVIALLRAMDVPARYAACYAPGLEPMDFHAVAEACIDGTWYVVDATRLADRRSLVRIATGRDAADCAFLSFHGGHVALTHLRVDAHSDPVAPDADDPAALRLIA